MAYIFGGNTGETPSSIKRKRAIAEALLAKNSRAPQNVGEGLSAIGNALLYRSMMNKVDKADDAGTAAAAADRAAFMSGFGAGATSPTSSTGAAADIGMPGAASEIAASNPSTVDLSGDKQTFIDSLLPAAVEESKRTGVDPRIIVAQAAQETGWGKSAPGNNFFGIKSHGKGGGQSLATHEYVDGKRVNVTDSFRTFGSPSESVRGYGDFILENPRYEKLRTAQGLDAQLAELQASGYATDPNYSRSVGAIARSIKLPTEVASIDPAAGAATAAGAIDAVAPASGYVDPAVSAPNSRRSPVVSALVAPTQAASQPSTVTAALATPPVAAGGASSGLPVGEVGSTTGRVVAPVRGSAVAQALVGGQQLPADYFPPAPAAPSAPSGPTVQQAVQLLNNPYATEADRAMAMSVIERQQQMNDPAYQLDQEYKRAQLEALRTKPTKEWQKLDDDTLFNPETGETRDVAGAAAGEGQVFRFKGTSVEAQALNGLMDSGQLTPEQAQQLAAGKTITNPADGSVVFLTPQGVFGQPASGGAPQPIQSPAAGGVQPPAPPAPPSPPVPGGTAAAGTNPGTLQITPGKGDRPTEAQRNRVASVDQAFDAITGELDRYAQLVDETGIEAIPGTAKDNLNSVRQGIMLQMKELFNLGVLNGPDLSLMERMIYDPVVDPLKEGGIANMPDQLWTSVTGNAGQRAKNSVAELKRMLENIRNSVGRQQKPAAPAADAGDVPDFSKMSDEELQRYLDAN